MNISIAQGNLQLLVSGVIHITDNESTKITLDNQFEIVIQYVDDAEKSEHKLELKKTDQGIAITLINFNNVLGTATNKPIGIASTEEETIYITLSVTAIGTVKILSYALYLGK